MTIPNHVAKRKSGLILERIAALPPGGKMSDLPPHLQHKSFVRTGMKKTGGPNLRILRLEHDKPSLTITAYIFNKFVHPTENRYITPREAALLQDFPLEWEFCGTLGQVHKQIGNAVPVKLAQALAESVLTFLQQRNGTGTILVASYFTGAGGLDLGFEQASSDLIKFKTVFSTDIEASVEKTIERNRPHWNFTRADIRDLNPNDVLTQIGAKPDVVIGGPPCQPFSVAGKQKAANDPTGTLYIDYIKQIEVLQPKIAVLENVYGLAQVKSINMVEEITAAFHRIGYHVRYRELLAADFGTPQLRRRLFFVAARDLDGFEFPQPRYCATRNLLGLPRYIGAGECLNKLPNPIIEEE